MRQGGFRPDIDQVRSLAGQPQSPLDGLRLAFDHIADGAEGGTRATIRIDIEGPLAFVARLAGGVVARNLLDSSLTALKGLLEAEAPGSSGLEPQQPPAEEPEAEAEPQPEAETEAQPEVKNE
ncbi:MAG: hypothetical protein IH822_06745 [Chloroflexi bacterium]|nr:hypothetical protein [Chloroflexota bacterium]